MSFQFRGVDPTSGPRIIIISFCDLQTSHEGQHMVSIEKLYSEKNTSGPIVTCDMSLLADYDQ